MAGPEDVFAGSPGRHCHRLRSGVLSPESRSLDRGLEEMLRVEEALGAVVATPPTVPAAATLAAQSPAPTSEG